MQGLLILDLWLILVFLLARYFWLLLCISSFNLLSINWLFLLIFTLFKVKDRDITEHVRLCLNVSSQDAPLLIEEWGFQDLVTRVAWLSQSYKLTNQLHCLRDGLHCSCIIVLLLQFLCILYMIDSILEVALILLHECWVLVYDWHQLR